MVSSIEKQTPSTLPPWLWFWLVVYAFSLPNQISLWQNNLRDLFFYQELPGNITGANSFFLLRLSNLQELIPSLALWLGILTIFVPKMRSARLEHKFELADPPSVPAMIEISEFLHGYAPGIRIKANLLRRDQLAFVYPLGYRKTAIAIFGSLIMLWRSDRQAAEAVLIHEVSHYHHGDTLIVGAGSWFRQLVEKWVLLYLFLCLLPFLLVLVEQTIKFFQEVIQLNSLGIPLWSILPSAVFHIITQFFLLILPGILIQLGGLFLWMANVFMLPLLGIWCSEFNADRASVNAKQSPENLVNALKKLPNQTNCWDWLLSRMSHPPDKMRQWMATYSQNANGLILLLLFFPMAYVAKLVALVGWTLTSYAFGATVNLSANIITYLKSIAPIWFLMAIFLLLWPILSKYWEKLFDGRVEILNQSKYKEYLFSALIVATLSILSYGLNFIER